MAIQNTTNDFALRNDRRHHTLHLDRFCGRGGPVLEGLHSLLENVIATAKYMANQNTTNDFTL